MNIILINSSIVLCFKNPKEFQELIPPDVEQQNFSDGIVLTFSPQKLQFQINRRPTESQDPSLTGLKNRVREYMTRGKGKDLENNIQSIGINFLCTNIKKDFYSVSNKFLDTKGSPQFLKKEPKNIQDLNVQYEIDSGEYFNCRIQKAIDEKNPTRKIPIFNINFDHQPASLDMVNSIQAYYIKTKDYIEGIL